MLKTSIAPIVSFVVLLFALGPPAGAQTVAIERVNVIPMTGNVVLPDQTVIVRNGRIDAIGPAESTKLPRRAERVDGQGRYLMPGLCDLHVHFFGGRLANPDLLKLYVANGVTTILNMRGGRGILEMRDQIATGDLLGPTLYSTSPILGNMGPSPKNFEKGVEVVEQFVEDDYDFIKVYNQIPKEGYEGIIDAAARLGIPVVGHAVRSVGIEGAIESGQSIAHMEELLYGYFKGDYDEAKIRPLAERFKEAGISVIATLITYHNIIRQVEDIDAMLASPGMEYLSDGVTRSWQPERNDYLARFDQAEVDGYLAPAFAFQQKIVATFTEVGVPILLGTDACIPVVVPGFSAHDELRELTMAGLSPYDALAAGTSRAATFLGGADEFGTIEKGKRADFILLNANPLEDVAHTKEIEGVMLRGDWFDRERLDQLLAELPSQAP